MVEIEINDNSAMYMGVSFFFFKLRIVPKIEISFSIFYTQFERKESFCCQMVQVNSCGQYYEVHGNFLLCRYLTTCKKKKRKKKGVERKDSPGC